jgi:iron(III) transport system substrate-binding protein
MVSGMPSPRVRCAAISLALVLLGPAALAQGGHLGEVTVYEGTDRQQKLLEGAKRERELTFYSSIPPDDIAALVSAFDKKYGIKVKVWRADSESVMQRILNENRTRRFDVDVIVASSSALEPLHRESLLTEVRSPHFAELIPEVVPAHREWVAVYRSLFVQAYNTSDVKRDHLPRSYSDLRQPHWKGQLGVEAEDFDWFAEVVKDLGEERGLQLFRDIMATNGISVRKGHSVLNNLVAAGEVPLALNDYVFLAEQSKRKGSPVDWFVLAPAIARVSGEGISRNAPHPHAALLFYDFLISDGQPVLAERQFLSVSRNVESPYKGPVKLIDSTAMLDEGRKWQDLFQKTIIGPSR